MSKHNDLIRGLHKELESSIEIFNKSIPGIQDNIASELELLVKDLELRNGRLVMSAKNLRVIARIKGKIEGIIRNRRYIKQVAEFARAFDRITQLQNSYFQALSNEFRQTPLLRELQRQSIDSTVSGLTEAGITANLTEPIQNILRRNITSGANYIKLLNQVRRFITTNEEKLGALERYAKQITTDSLNQYAAQYTQVVTNDLGLEWFMYTGALVSNSRAFCRALIRKKYIHVSEIPQIIKGEFPEFAEVNGELSKRTGLPEGMIPGTNEENFSVYRGGFNCGHQLVPVDSAVVPLVVRRAIDR